MVKGIENNKTTDYKKEIYPHIPIVKEIILVFIWIICRPSGEKMV
jgi:hypothetical protein